MKLNKIAASLFTMMGYQFIAPQAALADRIIQQPYGAFYIVSDQEAHQLFDRNNFGFFALPPSLNQPTRIAPAKKQPKKVSVKKASKKTPAACPPANCPVTPVKPVATVESAESIFLRLEKKKQ